MVNKVSNKPFFRQFFMLFSLACIIYIIYMKQKYKICIYIFGDIIAPLRTRIYTYLVKRKARHSAGRHILDKAFPFLDENDIR